MLTLTGSRRKARDLKYRQLHEGWEPAGNCTAPRTVSLRGLPDSVNITLGLDPERNAIVTYNVRCRKCPECRRARASVWRRRATAECALAPRTWFGTLTVRPERRVFHQYSAAIRAKRRVAGEWHTLSDAEQFEYLVQSIGPEVTGWLKRVRKNSGAVLRYLLAVEAHKDGFPHFHLLVHEAKGKVTKAQLDVAWREGFSQFRLVPDGDTRAAAYVCKYLTKSALTRIRASQRYGTAEPYGPLLTELVTRVTASGIPAQVRMPDIHRLSRNSETYSEVNDSDTLQTRDHS